MNLSKKFIGRFFFVTGFIGGMLVGYMQLTKNPLNWAYSIIYIMFLASWYMLFDYTKQVENK